MVLAKRLIPGTCQRWGASDDRRGWKRIFVVAEQHPAWGAEMAAVAGASKLTAESDPPAPGAMQSGVESRFRNGDPHAGRLPPVPAAAFG